MAIYRNPKTRIRLSGGVTSARSAWPVGSKNERQSPDNRFNIKNRAASSAKANPQKTAAHTNSVDNITRLRPKRSDRFPPMKPPRVPASAPAPSIVPEQNGDNPQERDRYSAKKGRL